MSAVFWVAAGGALGSVGRYLLSLGVLAISPAGWRFPFGTFVVNLLGCFCIGALAGVAERHGVREGVRLFVGVGVLGGFTTFSTFGLETWELLRRQEWALAGGYVAGSVLLGLGAVALGAQLIWPGR